MTMIIDSNNTYAQKLNRNTQKAQQILADLNYNTWCKSIYDAYDKPSRAKVITFNEIEKRALHTVGYNHDLHIVGHSCHQYSTIYSYTQDNILYVVKDTKFNTYVVEA